MLEAIDESGFTATGRFDGTTLTLRLSGQADHGADDRLDAFLQAADREAVAAGIKEVVVDFRQLGFMNSSCLKAFVIWLRRVQDRSGAQQYRIRFLRDQTSHWQTRSFSALAAFGRGVLTIE